MNFSNQMSGFITPVLLHAKRLPATIVDSFKLFLLLFPGYENPSHLFCQYEEIDTRLKTSIKHFNEQIYFIYLLKHTMQPEC